MEHPIKTSLEAASARLQQSGNLFQKIFENEQVQIELYKPREKDDQQPHDRDEFYIIISGTGRFRYLDQEMDFGPGDLFFVPAHHAHHFTAFSEDFATWVIFTGPVKQKSN